MPWRSLQPIAAQLLVGQRFGHQHVVVDRHGHEAVAPQQRGEHVRGEHGACAPCTRPPVGHDRDTVGPPCRGVAPASARRSRRRAPPPRARARRRACRGARAPSCACLEHRAQVGRARRRTPAPPSASSRTDALLTRGRGIRAHSSSHSSWCGSVATASAPVRSHSASMPYAAMSAPIASRFSRPSRSSWSISSGQRLSPFSRPCVRLASQNPPLRPDAAHPTVLRLDAATTRASGSRRLGEQRRPQPGVAAADDHEVGVVRRRVSGGRSG